MIIGFTGHKGSGKDTAATALLRHGFHRLAFADKIRNTCSTLYNISPDEFEHPIKEQVLDRWPYKSPRDILQTFGEAAKLVDPDVWLKGVEAKCRELEKQHQSVVITDIRFPPEFELIKSMGGSVYRVDRIGHVVNDTHISERWIKSFDVDYVLANNFETPKEFENYIFDIFKKLLVRVST